MPISEPASMPLVDYHHHHHHQPIVHLEDSYASSYSNGEAHHTALYGYGHQMMSQTTEGACTDYTGSTGYCPPHVTQPDYSYQHYTSAATAASVAPAAAVPCEAPSATFYNSPVGHYGSHHQSVENHAMMPYNCYPSSQDHLEVKYQAAYGNALESHNTSIEADGSVNASTSSAEMDHIRMQSTIHQPQMLTNIEQSGTQISSDFHYEYETNYGNNEWTTTSGSSANYSYSLAEGYPSESPATNEPDMPVMPNYCFAACVFTQSAPAESTSPHIKAEIGAGYSTSPTQARHFEPYDYTASAIVHESLHQAL